ncbi:MAG: N-acetyltransferase [Pseudomonadota bacterium]|uniref:GNAT family N-acetyltransferase n=1 Tax=Actibacterium sp. TaxID=1872125 RepID=UPI0006C924C6|nr:N-acetyltransferase [Actibacterium sp.]MDY6861316.1 N-acetyltransferase [Pseudomonadota bacterium]
MSILLDTAFGGPSEARLVADLRASGAMALELIAEHDGSCFGYVAFSHMRSPEGLWALSPVAVQQARQGQGIGGELIRQGLDLARRAGATAVIVVGDSQYYRRFGFSLKAAENLSTPFAREATMLYPIVPGSGGMRGALKYPEAFFPE